MHYDGRQYPSPCYRASMEPQLYRCGNLSTVISAPPAGTVLQWSRNFIVAEIVPASRKPRHHHDASMEPQLYRCGNIVVIAIIAQTHYCFNGAATLSLRKYGIPISTFPGVPWLQWSRNFIVAEMSICMAAILSVPLLQWSRNFIVAEITRHSYKALFLCQLQWSRNFIVAEIRQDGCWPWRQRPGFNGAATLSLRKFGWRVHESNRHA